MEVIYGQNPVIEALKAGRRHIEEIYTTREDLPSAVQVA